MLIEVGRRPKILRVPVHVRVPFEAASDGVPMFDCLDDLCFDSKSKWGPPALEVVMERIAGIGDADFADALRRAAPRVLREASDADVVADPQSWWDAIEASGTTIEWVGSLPDGALVTWTKTILLAPGDRVDHPKFGRGRVMGVEGVKARIEFDSGERSLLCAGRRMDHLGDPFDRAPMLWKRAKRFCESHDRYHYDPLAFIAPFTVILHPEHGVGSSMQRREIVRVRSSKQVSSSCRTSRSRTPCTHHLDPNASRPKRKALGPAPHLRRPQS